MSAPSTSGLSVGLLLRVIDVKYGCLLYFTLLNKSHPGLHCFQTWEKAIELCKELAKQYKSYLFDYVKVGDILVSEITDDFSMGHFSSDCGK